MNTGGPSPKTRRRRRAARWLAILLVPLVFMAIMVWTAPRPMDVKYGGRSADAWLRDTFGPQSSGATRAAAIDAFEHMGTNGMTFLVESLDVSQSLWTRVRLKIYWRSPPSVRKHLSPPPPVGAVLATASRLVLAGMRDSAPDHTAGQLARLLNSGNEVTRQNAAEVFEYYTSTYPAVNYGRFRPELVRALGDSNPQTTIRIVLAMHHAKLDGPELVPALLEATTNSNVNIKLAADAALEDVLTECIGSLEHLVPKRGEPQTDPRAETLVVLGPVAAPYLVEMIVDDRDAKHFHVFQYKIGDVAHELLCEIYHQDPSAALIRRKPPVDAGHGYGFLDYVELVRSRAGREELQAAWKKIVESGPKSAR